jgi:hypothetical protein
MLRGSVMKGRQGIGAEAWKLPTRAPDLSEYESNTSSLRFTETKASAIGVM